VKRQIVDGEGVNMLYNRLYIIHTPVISKRSFLKTVN